MENESYLILFFVIIYLIYLIKDQIYSKKLNQLIVEEKFNFMKNNIENLNFKNEFNNFQTIKNGKIKGYFISGLINKNYFDYREINSWFRRYSIIIIDADSYKPNFNQILIKRQRGLKKKQDFDLEWNDFNTTFDNRFKDPRQALEIVTPTFMENLFDLSKKYKELKFEYFETSNYQKNIFAIILYPAIFSRKRKNIEKEIINLKMTIKSLISLKESI